MREIKNSRVSPALIVTVVAKVAALGGGAVAAGTTISGKPPAPRFVRQFVLLGSCLIVLLSAFAVAGQGASAAPLFGAKTDFTTGTFPISTTIDDFNGDSKTDLAVANFSSNTVSVLLGVGDGSFAAKTDFTTGSAPFSVISNDFNGDSKTDLAVANFSSNTVSVLLGAGNGSFSAKTDFTTGTFPRSVTSADFNGDGKTDLAVANVNSNSVSVLLGVGDGSFAAKTDFTTGTAPFSVTSADFNGDSKTDLAVANSGAGAVSVLLGIGNGTFAAKTDFTTGPGPVQVTTEEFNGDDNPDLATANIGSDTVSVLLGDGTGNFGAKTDFATGDAPYGMTSSDFNGDGNPDLAAASQSSSSVSVLLGDGTGSFGAKAAFATGDGPYGMTSSDFNGDGIADLATASTQSNAVSVLLVNAPTATTDTTSLAFSAQILSTVSPAQTVTLTTPVASAGYPLLVNQVRTAGTNRNDFIVSTDECGGKTLPPSASCEVGVRFAPSGAGARTAALELRHNGASSPLIVSLTGTGESAPIGPTGPTGDTGPTGPTGVAGFNKVKVSGPKRIKKGKKATYKVKISNSGNAAATGVRLKVSGRGIRFRTSLGRIQGGTTRKVKVKLKPKRRGKVRASFKVTSENAGSKTVRKKITVRR